MNSSVYEAFAYAMRYWFVFVIFVVVDALNGIISIGEVTLYISLAITATEAFKNVVEKLNIPVVTGWNSIDEIYDEHPLYVGRGGIIAAIQTKSLGNSMYLNPLHLIMSASNIRILKAMC